MLLFKVKLETDGAAQVEPAWKVPPPAPLVRERIPPSAYAAPLDAKVDTLITLRQRLVAPIFGPDHVIDAGEGLGAGLGEGVETAALELLPETGVLTTAEEDDEVEVEEDEEDSEVDNAGERLGDGLGEGLGEASASIALVVPSRLGSVSAQPPKANITHATQIPGRKTFHTF